MRNKQFYDLVHEWDVSLAPLRSREEFRKVLDEDDSKKFFNDYFVKGSLYAMILYYFEGVTRSEITDCVCWVHDVPDNSRIKRNINHKVLDEVRRIEKKAREDGYNNIVAYVEKVEGK